MEGEALVADLSGFLHIVEEFRGADGLEVFPALAVDAVHQVKVDVVGLQFVQFFIQQRLHAGAVMDSMLRHLGRDGHLVAVAVLKGFAENDLGRLVQVDVGGIHIRHATVDRTTDQADRFLLVDDAVAGSLPVKAHAAQAESRGLDTQFAHGTVFHMILPLLIDQCYLSSQCIEQRRQPPAQPSRTSALMSASSFSTALPISDVSE